MKHDGDTAGSDGHRRLDVDGNVICSGIRPRTRERALLCTWREACRAVDDVLTHFGDPRKDRGIWVWYCQRLGLNAFLDIADDVVGSWERREIKWPAKALQRHLMEVLPKNERCGGNGNCHADGVS